MGMKIRRTLNYNTKMAIKVNFWSNTHKMSISVKLSILVGVTFHPYFILNFQFNYCYNVPILGISSLTENYFLFQTAEWPRILQSH